MKKLIIGTIVAGGMTLGALQAAAQIRAAPGVPPAHPSYSHTYVPFLDYIQEESEGRLSAVILGPEVVNLGQMRDALNSELAQVGLYLPLYFPAELPYMSTAAEVALIGVNPHAMASALTEYIVTCAPCQAELQRFGVIYLGSGSTNTYHFVTTRPVNNLADLRGIRLRSGGAPWSRWAEHVGAVPVNLPVGETFEAMSQGTIDGTMTSLADLLSFRLVELASHVNMMEMGTYHATSNFTVTQTTWNSLDAQDRAAFARAANRANADMTQRWAYEMTDMAIAAGQEAGITFSEPEADLAEAFADFAVSDAQTVADLSRERFGLEDAHEQVARFMELVEKWDAIVEEIGPDAVAIAARVQQEVWDHVDFASYGQ
ncbi:MAG: C4-dicarboxylate TRAP transporter substrate-binding protein [Pararhodobacter sp.]